MPEIIKQFIKTNQLLQPQRVRSVIDFDCTVPDGQPDITSILAVDGACTVSEATPEKGKITVNYIVHYKILYLAGPDNEVKAITTQSNHTAIVDIPEINEDSTVFARCALEHLEYNISNSRKLAIKCVVKIIADGNNTVELGIPTDVSDMDDVQTRTTPYTLSTISESIDTTLELAESSELGGGKPSIGCILRSDPSICDITVVKIGDSITVKGNLTVCTLYESEGDNKRLEIIESHIPFTHTVPSTRPSEDPALTVRSEIKAFRAEIGEDSDGLPRIIDIRADIRFCIVGYMLQTGEMLSDAYSLTKKFNLGTAEIEAFIRKDDITAQFVLKEPLTIDGDLPPIKEVVDITGQIGQADITVEDDMITVDGYVVCSALYITGNPERPLVSCKKQIPFTHTIEKRGLKSTAMVPLRLYVSHTSFSLLSPSEMELRIAIAARGEIIDTTTLTVITELNDITDINCQDGNTHRPSILVYIVQSGDTLWKIAKRYNAPMDALIAINNIKNPDELTVGQKLLISC